MDKSKTGKTKNYGLIAILIVSLLIIGMACNLLSLGSKPEEPTEVPTLVVNQELQEPAQEEPTAEPVVEEPEPTAEPVQEQPVVTSDELYLTGQQAVIPSEYYTYGLFMVKNPKTDCSYESAKYTLTAYDDQNQQIYTEDGYIEIVLAGGTMGEIVYFPDEAENTHHFDVALEPGACTASEYNSSVISFDKPMLYDDENYPSATAQIYNNLNTYQTEIYVVAVGFDAGNQIVALGSSYVNILAPSDYSGVKVSMNRANDTVIDRLEFFGTHSYFSETSVDDSYFNTVYLDDYVGSRQIEDTTELVFFIQNDHQTMAASDIEYQVTLFDEQDYVIAVQTGYIDHILPGDYTAEYLDIYLPENVTYASYYVQLIPGEFTDPFFPSNPFTADNYAYDDSSYFPIATFDLKNGSNKAVSDLSMIVVLYDVDGYFIGGGSVSSDTINPNSTTGQEVYVNVDGEPDSMEVYLVIDYWTEIAQ